MKNTIPTTAYRVRQSSNRDEIAAFLNRDRLYAGYALCDLDDGYFSTCRWFLAENAAGEVCGLAMEFGQLSPVVLFLMGEAACIPLDQAITPRFMQMAAQADHLAPLRRRYRLHELHQMLRMAVRKAEFRPSSQQAQAEPLTERDLPELNRLYRMASGSAFAPYQLQQGIFYGVKVQGRLVATAGTHLLSATQRIVAVGNVFTLPHFRGQGFAQATTSAVTAEALRSFGPDAPGQPEALAILNVRADNPPAIAAYTKLGYREARRYYEAYGGRRWFSRLWAR
jgi:ribosomal protein S18 acetylase RimI-like enzyme